MPTIKELWDKGIDKIRLPVWEPFSYLQLTGEGKLIHPTAILFGVGGSKNGKRLLIVTEFLNPEYLEWKQPEDFEERKNEMYREVI